MKIHLLLTGTELMTGDIVDTNSQYIAQRLAEYGIVVHKKVQIGDDLPLLIAEIQAASNTCDILLINGGLGPTDDDLTAQALAQAFSLPLIESEAAKSHLIQWCQLKNIPLSKANLKQAMLPQGAEIIDNPVGSAVGIELKLPNCTIFCTPGVPSELYAMIEQSLLNDIVEQHSASTKLRIEKFLTFGIGESALQQRIWDEISDWPQWLKLGFRAAKPYLEVKLSYGANVPESDILLWRQKLTTLIADHWLIEGNNVQQCVQALLLKNGQKITTAESCTGGLIASMITQNPGSSAIFEAGFVTYSNAQKQSMIGVSASSLSRYGAVSETVVKEMALGALKHSGADYAIAVSGIAGPDGGSADKPVGTVWIAWGKRNNVNTIGLNIPGDRKIFQHYVAVIALDLIRRQLSELPPVAIYIKSRQIKSQTIT